MSTTETRQVVEGFLGSFGGHWLAEDVDLQDPARPRCVRGRASVATWFTQRHAQPHWPSLLIDADSAAVELKLRETPDGPPVATVAIFEVRAGEIAVARVYVASTDSSKR